MDTILPGLPKNIPILPTAALSCQPPPYPPNRSAILATDLALRGEFAGGERDFVEGLQVLDALRSVALLIRSGVRCGVALQSCTSAVVHLHMHMVVQSHSCTVSCTAVQ